VSVVDAHGKLLNTMDLQSQMEWIKKDAKSQPGISHKPLLFRRFYKQITKKIFIFLYY